MPTTRRVSGLNDRDDETVAEDAETSVDRGRADGGQIEGGHQDAEEWRRRIDWNEHRSLQLRDGGIRRADFCVARVHELATRVGRGDEHAKMTSDDKSARVRTNGQAAEVRRQRPGTRAFRRARRGWRVAREQYERKRQKDAQL